MRLAGTKLAANHQYRGFGDQLYDLSGQRPSLDLNFANTKSLVDATTGQNLVTFTRASSGTYVDSQGVIRTATTNEARFDHNPTTGESLGLLVEESRTNLSQQSDNFSDAYWVKTDCTITSNESTAPDGTLTADLWTNTASPGIVASSTITKDATARTYTGSLWVKGGGTAFTMSIDSTTSANRGRAVFNMSSGTLTSVFNDGNFTGTSGTITAYANGWYRLTVTTTTSTFTGIRLRPFFSGAGSTARIWGAQVEEGAFPTSYIPTTTATVTRSADVASITGSNFSSWYRQDEGTVFASATNRETYPGINVFPYLAQIDDSTNNNRVSLDFSTLSGGYRYNFAVRNNNVTQLEIGPFGIAQNSAQWAVGLKSSDFAASVSVVPATVFTSTTGTLPTVMTQLRIGIGFGKQFNGTIRRLTYFPTRLANETLQRITQ